MAFPAIAAVNGGNSAAGTTSHTVNLPASIASGDLLIVLFATDGSPAITWPSGWTQIAALSYFSAVRLEARYRIADGSEGATIALTTDVSEGSAHTSYRITGHSGNAPEGQIAAPGTSGLTIDPPSLTPTWGAKDSLWLAIGAHDNSQATTMDTYPTNYTDGRHDQWNNGSGVGLASARRELNATSDDPGTFGFTSATNQGSVGLTVAVEPGTGGGTPVFEIRDTVTLGGVAQAGATVRLYNMTTDTYVGSTTTDVAGEFVFTSLVETDKYHVFIEYDSGTQQYQALSEPYISPTAA